MTKTKKKSKIFFEIEIFLNIRYKVDFFKMFAKKQIKNDELKTIKSIMKRFVEIIVDSIDDTFTFKKHIRIDQFKFEKKQLISFRLKKKKFVNK